MIKSTLSCDRCKRDFHGSKLHIPCARPMERPYIDNTFDRVVLKKMEIYSPLKWDTVNGVSETKFDLCPECSKMFIDWITNYEDNNISEEKS